MAGKDSVSGGDHHERCAPSPPRRRGSSRPPLRKREPSPPVVWIPASAGMTPPPRLNLYYGCLFRVVPGHAVCYHRERCDYRGGHNDTDPSTTHRGASQKAQSHRRTTEGVNGDNRQTGGRQPPRPGRHGGSGRTPETCHRRDRSVQIGKRRRSGTTRRPPRRCVHEMNVFVDTSALYAILTLS